MEQRDTLIFLVEALTVNRKTHQDIDALYKAKEPVFTTYAKRSALYKHPLIVGGSTYHEEFGKKALGIASYAMEAHDKAISDKVDDIVQKGWPRAYDHIMHYNKTDMDAYIDTLKEGAAQSVAENTAELFVFYSLCMKVPSLVVKIGLKEIQQFFLMLFFRDYLNKDDKYIGFYEKMNKIDRVDLEDRKSRIFLRYGIEIAEDNRIHIKDEWLARQYRFFYRLAFTEHLSLYYLLKDIEMDEHDIMEVFCAISGEIGGKDGNLDRVSEEETASLFLSGMMVKLLAKVVEREKNYYFYRMEEYTGGEIGKKEKAIAKLTGENDRLKAEVRRLKESLGSLSEKHQAEKREAEKPHLDKIRALERELAKRDDALRQEREKERELVALREFIFSMDNQTSAGDAGYVPEAKTKVLMDLKDTVGAIIGGNPRWGMRMKDLLPKWVFISSPGFDKRSLDGIQTVCFVPGNMGHTLYYKVMNIAKSRNLDIGFIHSQNELLALQEIAKVLAKAEN